MNHFILHLDLDSFFVSVERLLNPDLAGKAVIVGGTEQFGVVSSCSYEARKFGVHSAMSTMKARQLCPHGIFIHGQYHKYGLYSKMVTDIIAARAPLFEKASVDEFYVDLTGMDKYFGCWEWSTALRKSIIKETGLPISFGLSVNKMLAKMATNEAKPNGQFMIEPGKEQEFLDPKPVGKIPFCGEKTEQFLNARGIYTIRDLRQFSEQALEQLMGKPGVELWHRAHGRASATVHPYHEQKSISSERTFDYVLNDTEGMKKVISKLTEKLGTELRDEQKTCGCVSVKIRYNDFSTFSRQVSVSPSSNTRLLLEKAQMLFDTLYEPGRKVRLLGVRFSNLHDSSFQINMFEDREKDRQLYKAIDAVKHKYGMDKLLLAQNMNTASDHSSQEEITSQNSVEKKKN